MPSLKLISINIELSKHLDRVLPFLESQKPDVVCMQELCDSDVPRIAQTLGMPCPLYVDMGRELVGGEYFVHGIGMFSRLPMTNLLTRYYAGDPSRILDYDATDSSTFSSTNRMIIAADVQKDGGQFRIATTHFTWSERGAATDLQRRDLAELFHILSAEKEFVLCGDFNLPRGGELFGEIAKRYKDNIPPEYKTSLDLDLHRAGKIRPHELADKMVDGLFSTPAYAISDVQLVPGVSDHCAIVSMISKNKN